MLAVIVRNLRTVMVLVLQVVLTVATAHAVDKGKTSYTAEAVCAFRSIAAQDPDPKTRNPDFLAEKFVSPVMKDHFPGVGLAYADAKMAMDRMNSGVFYYVNARTHHMDATLTAALKAGARQVVILGAGFDSRAYRFHRDYPEVRFFEIDLPATSADKQKRVESILGKRPDWVTYVPIDFNTQTLEEVLTHAGFAKGQKSFYVWEGVTYFISQAGVESTLRFIAEHSAPGSGVVFDYMLADVIQGMDYSPYGARRTVFYVGHRGEPYVFGVAPQQLEGFVNRRGLELLSDLGPAELSQRYLVRSNGKVSGKIAGFLRIVHVRVPSSIEQAQLRQHAEDRAARKTAQKNLAPTLPVVEVPDDVQVFLNDNSRCIIRKDLDALLEHYSPNYRSNGRSREQVMTFLARLLRSRPMDQHQIVLTKFQRTGDKAKIDGFIQRKGFRIPLMGLDIIIESDGRWRWYGNQK